jgi:hypothetical protein
MPKIQPYRGNNSNGKVVDADIESFMTPVLLPFETSTEIISSIPVSTSRIKFFVNYSKTTVAIENLKAPLTQISKRESRCNEFELKSHRKASTDFREQGKRAATARALSRELNMESRKGTGRTSIVASIFAVKYGSMYNFFLQFTSNELKTAEVSQEFDQFKRSDFNVFIG